MKLIDLTKINTVESTGIAFAKALQEAGDIVGADHVYEVLRMHEAEKEIR